MNWFGVLLCLVTCFVIGIGFVWVIRGERHLGYLWWPYTMGLGIVLVIGSLLLKNNWASALIGVTGASLAWGSTELKEQAVRAELGWYPFKKKKIAPPFVEVIKKWPPPHL